MQSLSKMHEVTPQQRPPTADESGLRQAVVYPTSSRPSSKFFSVALIQDSTPPQPSIILRDPAIDSGRLCTWPNLPRGF